MSVAVLSAKENNMAEITYGKSIGPKTAKGRRRLKRKSLQEAFIADPQNDSAPKKNRVQAQLDRRAYIPPSISSARPLIEIANKVALSVKEYKSGIELALIEYENRFNRIEIEPYKDAMSLVVNHAHQRNPKKKW